MSWWMVAYLLLFIVVLVGNVIFWLKNHGNAWILTYELCSGIFLIYAVIALWYPVILKTTTIWPVLAVPAVLLFECYYSIWGDTEALIPAHHPRLTGIELETSKAFSILLASPAYIAAAKLFIDTFF